MQNKTKGLLTKQFIFFALNAILLVVFSNDSMAKTVGTSAEVNGVSYNSVEWQAIKLQESIESKIKRSLRPIVADDDYIIEVKVKIDLDRAEDPTPKKKIKSVQRKKVQFSNVAFPKDGDAFVVFNKLGLEAPIVGEEPIESEVSDAELNQKAIIELNDRYNLFNFLESVNVNITFDNGLSPKTRGNIKSTLDGLSFYLKDAIPQFNVQYVELKEKPEEIVDEEKEKGKKVEEVLKEVPPKEEEVKKEHIVEERRPAIDKKEDRFKNLDIMIGLIVGAVVLGLAALYIAKSGSKSEEKIESDNVNDDTSEQKVEEEIIAENEDTSENNDNQEETGEDMIDLTLNDAVTAKINQGLERFRTVMQHHKSDTILLIKEWIKAGSESEAAALTALVQVLNDQELSEIFKLLSIDERGSWKLFLDGEMKKEEVAKAFIFIGNEIIKMMMVPSLIEDYEVCDLLLSLSAEDASKYCVQYPDLGIVFTNVLSGKVISEMFKLLPNELSLDIIERSTVFRKDEILKQMPLLKGLLLKSKASKERPPFLKTIIEILPTAKADLERKLYSTLLNHLTIEETSLIAVSILPSEVLDRLPGETFKEVMSVMSQEDQIVYLACLSEGHRNKQLERFAPAGSKSRDLIEIELSTVLGNEMMMKRLNGERKNMVMQNFLKVARDYLSKNAEAKKEVQPVMREWLDGIKKEAVTKKARVA